MPMLRQVPDQFVTGGDKDNAQKAWLDGYDQAMLEISHLLKMAYSAVPEDRKGRTRCVDPDPAGGTYEFTEHEWSVKARQILGLKYEPTGI